VPPTDWALSGSVSSTVVTSLSKPVSRRALAMLNVTLFLRRKPSSIEYVGRHFIGDWFYFWCVCLLLFRWNSPVVGVEGDLGPPFRLRAQLAGLITDSVQTPPKVNLTL